MKFASTKERIVQFIDYKGIKKADFFAKTGIKRGFLDGDKLDSTVNDIFIAKIIASYPELNIEWLLTGKGEPIKQESNPGYYTAVSGNDNRFGNITQGDRNAVGEPQTTRLEKGETEMLRKEISHLNDMLKEKERALEEKERLIQILLKK